MAIRYALISVSDRTGVVEFAHALTSCGFEILSTGGTAAVLRDGGIAVTEVADITGAPEMLDGRVKTLHPTIHGGIMARRDVKTHVDALIELGIPRIDVVVNNLYPFTRQVREGETSLQEAVELIDIGGPAMTRAAAKNHEHVVVVVDPDDYELVGKMLVAGDVPTQERTRLALKAFQHVAHYDATISDYLRAQVGGRAGPPHLPAEFAKGFRLIATPRYGENPHQVAGVYAAAGGDAGIVNAEQLHGIPMSYLNYYDADAAWSVTQGFGTDADSHVVAIVKHANPCGIAERESQSDAWAAALAGDPVSAFGGIVAFNGMLQSETAEAMRGLLLDVIVAPDYSDGALAFLRKRKRTRVLKVRPTSQSRSELEVRTISGGALLQARDFVDSAERDRFKVVTKTNPTDNQLDDLWFAWRACRFIRSNAIALAKDNALVGMGAGQPNRVNSVELACKVAGDAARGSAMASDAFFPFPDGIELAARNGVMSVVQPGGSVNDEAVISAADELGLAMVFTGTRHFYH